MFFGPFFKNPCFSTFLALYALKRVENRAKNAVFSILYTFYFFVEKPENIHLKWRSFFETRWIDIKNTKNFLPKTSLIIYITFFIVYGLSPPVAT